MLCDDSLTASAALQDFLGLQTPEKFGRKKERRFNCWSVDGSVICAWLCMVYLIWFTVLCVRFWHVRFCLHEEFRWRGQIEWKQDGDKTGQNACKLTHLSLVPHCQNGKQYKWKGNVHQRSWSNTWFVIWISYQMDPSEDQLIDHATSGPNQIIGIGMGTDGIPWCTFNACNFGIMQDMQSHKQQCLFM